MEAQVEEDVRQARRDELVSLQQGIGRDFAEALAGSEARPSVSRHALASKTATQCTPLACV